MGYNTRVGGLPDVLASIRNGKIHDPYKKIQPSGRTILKGGLVVDPANGIEEERDVAFIGPFISEVADKIKPERGDRVFEVAGLQVWPGLIDMHLHLGDLFETSSAPIFRPLPMVSRWPCPQELAEEECARRQVQLLREQSVRVREVG